MSVRLPPHTSIVFDKLAYIVHIRVTLCLTSIPQMLDFLMRQRARLPPWRNATHDAPPGEQPDHHRHAFKANYDIALHNLFQQWSDTAFHNWQFELPSNPIIFV